MFATLRTIQERILSTITIPPGARIFLLLASLPLAVHISGIFLKTNPNSPWAFLYLAISILCLVPFHALGFWAANLFRPGRHWVPKALFGAACAWGFLGIDSLHYRVFSVHLTAYTVRTAAYALHSGEIQLPLLNGSRVIQALATAVAVSVFFWILLRLTRLGEQIASRPLNRLTAGLLFLGTAILISRGSYAPHLRAASPRFVPELLPGETLTWIPSLRFRSAYSGDNSLIWRPLELRELKRYQRHRREAIEAARTGKVAAKRTPDILIFHVESLRSTQLDPRQMPYLWARVEKCRKNGSCHVGKRHSTSGNNTGSGMFGILHGLPLNYFPYFRLKKIDPFPLTLLRELGYRVSLRYTKDMAYDGLNSFYFGAPDIRQMHYNQPQSSIESEEARLLEEYAAELLNEPKRRSPRLDYLVSYATHFRYYYPKEFEHFTPTSDLDGQLKSGLLPNLKPHAESIRNRFFNASRFIDASLERLLEALERAGRLKNAIVVVFGDHGEEFWEKGQFGHTFGLSREQIETVFAVFYGERVTPNEYEYTNHADLMPTLFDFMGLTDSLPPVFAGKSLFEYRSELDFSLTGRGALGTHRAPGYVVASDGLKLELTSEGIPLWESLRDDEDRRLASSPESDRVRELLKRAHSALRIDFPAAKTGH